MVQKYWSGGGGEKNNAFNKCMVWKSLSLSLCFKWQKTSENRLMLIAKYTRVGAASVSVSGCRAWAMGCWDAQDGGSPDNSGAAGKSHFTDFVLPLLLVRGAFCWEHMSVSRHPSHWRCIGRVFPPGVGWRGIDVVDKTASGPFVRSLPDSTDSGVQQQL